MKVTTNPLPKPTTVKSIVATWFRTRITSTRIGHRIHQRSLEADSRLSDDGQTAIPVTTKAKTNIRTSPRASEPDSSPTRARAALVASPELSAFEFGFRDGEGVGDSSVRAGSGSLLMDEISQAEDGGEGVDCVGDRAERAGQHVVEDAIGYTQGPVRVVLADDGVDRVSALLLNLELIRGMCESIRLHKSIGEFEAKEEVDRRFVETLRGRMRRLREQLQTLDGDGAVAERPGTVEHQRLQSEFEKLRLLFQNTEARNASMAAQKQTRVDRMIAVQGEVNAIVEEAFVAARLLHSDPEEEARVDAPNEELEIDEEYEKLRRQTPGD